MDIYFLEMQRILNNIKHTISALMMLGDVFGLVFSTFQSRWLSVDLLKFLYS